MMDAHGRSLKQITHCTGSCVGMGVPNWSPDGRKIAYSVAVGPPRPNGDASVEALWIMHADGSHPVQFTNPPLPTSYTDNGPAWSPDGTKIVIAHRSTTGVDQNAHLYEMNADGSDLVQVT